MGLQNGYFRPTSVDEALDHLAANDLTIAAGCTDLFPATEQKTLGGPVLDISGITALRGFRKNETGITIGATTTWSDLIAAPLPSAFGGLKLAAREVGARQIQNRGTLAGNLCNASPAADGVPPLLTLDAQVVLASKAGRRVMPLADFLIGPRQTARRADELLEGVHIPASALMGDGQFLKLGARKYLVISIAMVAARLVIADGVVAEAALAIGACGPVAARLPKAEAALVGQPMDPGLINASHLQGYLAPIDDMRADAAYRTTVATELVQRILGRFAESRSA
jgi:CO/xanthine dehydrogenase FAD-binding subunit